MTVKLGACVDWHDEANFAVGVAMVGTDDVGKIDDIDAQVSSLAARLNDASKSPAGGS